MRDHGEPSGMLTTFVNRLRSRNAGFEASAQSTALCIWVSDGSVYRDGTQLEISEGGWGLLSALAIEERPTTREALCDKLWPDLDLEDAHNALKMCVRRTRVQIGDPTAIVAAKGGGYNLSSAVDVDLRRLTQIRSAVAREGATLAEVPDGKVLFERLRRGRPPAFLDYEWFEATEQWLQRLTLELGEFIAREALRQDDPATAVQIGEYLTKFEPFDEAGPSVLIAAYLAVNRRGAALAEYRQYRKVLAHELGVEPSDQLKKMLQTA